MKPISPLSAIVRTIPNLSWHASRDKIDQAFSLPISRTRQTAPDNRTYGACARGKGRRPGYGANKNGQSRPHMISTEVQTLGAYTAYLAYYANARALKLVRPRAVAVRLVLLVLVPTWASGINRHRFEQG